ncbi:hypothetical protein FQR65_LT20043 [Abscondita terminalis]|nr:hypothetical protein FQR65_LT20043 [Abscondita terminalis]
MAGMRRDGNACAAMKVFSSDAVLHPRPLASVGKADAAARRPARAGWSAGTFSNSWSRPGTGAPTAPGRPASVVGRAGLQSATNGRPGIPRPDPARPTLLAAPNRPTSAGGMENAVRLRHVGSGLGGTFMFRAPLRLAWARKAHQSSVQAGIGGRQRGDHMQGGVGGAGFADGESGHRHALGHLHDGQQGSFAAQGTLDGPPGTPNTALRSRACIHARQVGRAAAAGDMHAQAGACAAAPARRSLQAWRPRASCLPIAGEPIITPRGGPAPLRTVLAVNDRCRVKNSWENAARGRETVFLPRRRAPPTEA